MKFEADVKIKPLESGGWSVLINGEEMAGLIEAESFSVEFSPERTEWGQALVHMTVPASVEIDAPKSHVVTGFGSWCQACAAKDEAAKA